MQHLLELVGLRRQGGAESVHDLIVLALQGHASRTLYNSKTKQKKTSTGREQENTSRPLEIDQTRFSPGIHIAEGDGQLKRESRTRTWACSECLPS